jgi:putative flippase GtrA
MPADSRAKEPAGFLVVGTIGFLVDAAILATLFHLAGLNPFTSRVISFSVAVVTTWWLNRSWTFSHRASRRRGREFARYLLVQFAGCAINFAVYSAAIVGSTTMAAYPTAALAVGSLVAMVFNFIACRNFTFTGDSAASPVEVRLSADAEEGV